MFKLIDNYFFDFDGVIKDSVDCKTNAFEAMYMKYGDEISDKVKNYHLKHGGISRYEKFKFWHKNYLNIELSNDEIKYLANEFSSMVLNKVINSKYVKGVTEFIKANHQKKKMWVITGTPTSEILIILNKLDLMKFFEGAFGSPKKKTFWCEKIIKENNLDRSKCIFFGDALTDYEASKNSSIEFALRETANNADVFKNEKILKFKDFGELINLDEK